MAPHRPHSTQSVERCALGVALAYNQGVLDRLMESVGPVSTSLKRTVRALEAQTRTLPPPALPFQLR